MPHYYCPCGLLLSRASTVRTLRPAGLRLFMTIKTMKPLAPETKICSACRTAYYTWKAMNPDFGDVLSRIDAELSRDDDEHEESSSVKIFIDHVPNK